MKLDFDEAASLTLVLLAITAPWPRLSFVLRCFKRGEEYGKGILIDQISEDPGSALGAYNAAADHKIAAGQVILDAWK